MRAKQEQRVFLCLALFFVTFVTRLLPVTEMLLIFVVGNK